MVEQLGVAGEHAAAGGTGHQSLLSVAPHVLPQTVPYLEEGVAPWDGTKKGPLARQHGNRRGLLPSRPTCPAAEERLLLGKRLLLGTFYVVVHVAVEPLGIVKSALQIGFLKSTLYNN